MTRLEEEGEEAFGRERRAEDVADEARVVGPVRAERELHGDPRGDPDREGRREQPDPELGGCLVGGDAALVVAAFGSDHHDREADAHRHEDEVVRDRESELDAGEHYGVHACPPPPWQARFPPRSIIPTEAGTACPGPFSLSS
jgi:hypothetical protein